MKVSDCCSPPRILGQRTRDRRHEVTVPTAMSWPCGFLVCLSPQRSTPWLQQSDTGQPSVHESASSRRPWAKGHLIYLIGEEVPTPRSGLKRLLMALRGQGARYAVRGSPRSTQMLHPPVALLTTVTLATSTEASWATVRMGIQPASYSGDTPSAKVRRATPRLVSQVQSA